MNRSAPINSRVFGLASLTQRIALALVFASAASASQPKPAEPPGPALPVTAFSQEVPVAAYKIDMLLVPGSTDGAIKPFFMSKCEVTWEAFDVFIYRLDEEAGKGPKNADAVTRPSKPYLPPDRGFGHEGFAAISMSHKNATEFCKWLSGHTGRTYRLPTEAEWEHAARAGDKELAAKPTGTVVPQGVQLAECAWLASNAGDAPHPVGKKKPSALGLHDMLGNVAEWVDGRDGRPVTKGGSFRDEPAMLTVAGRVPTDPAWNRSDPQVPKSKWWLADAPFIGFRIVCETPLPTDKQPSEAPVTKPDLKSPTQPTQPAQPAPVAP
ncbi:MAG TPA: SUMF1/EgtB/PvdO family nonheme iron enzyme, partial [Phycisphaerales bacterium]|nr:SUMF1/EgtB/PvdO family nonheme iron enzyme [Phycisphaerales bacterium]